MRGRDQDQILQALRARRAGEAEPEAAAPKAETAAEQVASLEESIDRFWDPEESLDTFPLTINLSLVDMPLLKRLGDPAFLGSASLQDLLGPVYTIFTRSALRAAYSEEEPLEPNNGNGNGHE